MRPSSAPSSSSGSGRHARRRAAVLSGTGALALLATAAPATAAGPSPAVAVPAAGSVVTCTSTGPLTATAGYLRQQETTTVDARGRAHVLFTIAADGVRLTGPDGGRYRLLGAGFDAVEYPTTAVTGPVVREDEVFTFAVVGPTGLAGVVRFRSRTGSDQVPHVTDASTCSLPGMGGNPGSGS